MKIGFDAKRAFHNSTGLGNYARNLLVALETHYPQHHYVWYTPPRGTAWSRRSVAPHVTIREPRSALGRALPAVWRSIGLATDCKRSRLDVFHGLSNELPLRSPGRARRVVTIHDLIFLRHPEFFPAIDRATYLWKTRHACRQADAIVAVSHRTRSDLVEQLAVDAGKVRVIHQSCDPVYYEPVAPERLRAVKQRHSLPERYVLSVGTIEERKNLLLVVQAMAKRRWDADLVVVGRKRGYFEKVRAFIDSAGLGSRVRFLDTVPSEDLPALYAGAAVFVYPSLYEGFGIPLLEALAVGTPAIAARGSCLEEAGGPGSLYVDPRDADALCDSVSSVLEDPELAATLARQGRSHAASLHPRQSAAACIALYEELTGARH